MRVLITTTKKGGCGMKPTEREITREVLVKAKEALEAIRPEIELMLELAKAFNDEKAGDIANREIVLIDAALAAIQKEMNG